MTLDRCTRVGSKVTKVQSEVARKSSTQGKLFPPVSAYASKFKWRRDKTFTSTSAALTVLLRDPGIFSGDRYYKSATYMRNTTIEQFTQAVKDGKLSCAVLNPNAGYDK